MHRSLLLCGDIRASCLIRASERMEAREGITRSDRNGKEAQLTIIIVRVQSQLAWTRKFTTLVIAVSPVLATRDTSHVLYHSALMNNIRLDLGSHPRQR